MEKRGERIRVGLLAVAVLLACVSSNALCAEGQSKVGFGMTEKGGQEKPAPRPENIPEQPPEEPPEVPSGLEIRDGYWVSTVKPTLHSARDTPIADSETVHLAKVISAEQASKLGNVKAEIRMVGENENVPRVKIKLPPGQG